MARFSRASRNTAPRLTYDQVAARSRADQAVLTRRRREDGVAASNQFGNVVSQIAPIIGAAIANGNNNRGYLRLWAGLLPAQVLATTVRRPAITATATRANAKAPRHGSDAGLAG